MDEFRDAYGKNATPEAEYQNGYMDGYVAGKEACADEIARLREALEKISKLENVTVSDFDGAEWEHQRIARAALAEQTGFNEPIPHKPQYPFEIKSSADLAEKGEK